ncbi:MAG TPA: GIY-YIG nuclease family protein [Thermoanaerobaculia bacterium]|nr:GIY-YIG nuclease family protein [Thermoanaerobaculia bacterium]
MNGSSPRPFSIKIFLPAGTPEGLRIIEKSNWTGVGVVFPRALFPDVKARSEFSRTGVYVLVGPSEEGELPMIYIGEADPIRRRLEQHQSGKDFWTWAVVFVSKDGSLNKAHVSYLESHLLTLAKDSRRSHVDNVTGSNEPSLAEADEADAASFLSDMLSIFPLLGLPVFERPRADRRRKRQMLHLRGKGLEAKGFEGAEGFVVLEGSQAAATEVPSIVRSPFLTTLRRELREKGVLAADSEHFRFMQDYAFNSPSTAAGVVLGRAANGRTEWQDGNGRTLKAIQEAQVKSTAVSEDLTT